MSAAQAGSGGGEAPSPSASDKRHSGAHDLALLTAIRSGVVLRNALLQKTVGYCCPTSFKVLGVLFLGEVSSAFLPAKKACWAHQFPYLRVGQQYPPGFARPRSSRPLPTFDPCSRLL